MKTWRDLETTKAIRHVEVVLASWLMLMVAAPTALLSAGWDMIHK